MASPTLSSPRTARRISQIFQRAQSPYSERPSEQHDADDASSGLQDSSRPRATLRQRAESPSFAGSFSSSLNQKTPARSYYQRPYYGSIGPSDFSRDHSQGVREDTAELASRALSDTEEQSYGVLDTSNSQKVAETGRRHTLKARDSGITRHPEIIQEASEPGSLEDVTPARPATGKSILTQLIQNSPPTDSVDDTGSSTESQGTQDQDDDFSVAIGGIISQPHESTPLLNKRKSMTSSRSHLSSHDIEAQGSGRKPQLAVLRDRIYNSTTRAISMARVITDPSRWDRKVVWRRLLVQPASYLPAVVLGLLLNILDALSYGMILFPLGQPLFKDLGPDGMSMFYVSCIVSQVVYSAGGSIFKGGIGSEMIEVVPFFHKMAFTIMAQVGEDNPKAVLATTILSYSMSSILTGLVFYIMGLCNLGRLIGFFPRHILIGCIGGVGWFLVATGVEVSARLDGNLEYSLRTLQKLVEFDTVFLWTVPLLLAMSLFILKRWVTYALTDAVFFIAIIAMFYVLEAAIPDLNLTDLRSKGWVFDAPPSGIPWYHFYTLYDFGAVNWEALFSTIPAMFALTFFGVLHVPINVPALAFTTGEDNLDINRELRAHGYSNALSGCLGSIQNYLVYTNTVLFMKSGADSRVAGLMLAAATAGILFIGPVIIGYIPIMVVGALIYYLGLDLMREALIDTMGRVNGLEYLTILIIVVTMGAYDFVVGILAGIVLACVSFVLQTSQISAIRAALPGDVATSTVRRHPTQRKFLKEVGRQIYVMKLAGYLFFGTIVGVENRVRALLQEDVFDSQPIRYLVLDLSKVDGLDFSAAEAFSRIIRILNVRGVQMVVCGFTASSKAGQSLCNVGLLGATEETDDVDYFEGLNSALEFCENELLRALYKRKDALDNLHATTQFLDVPQPNAPQIPEETIFSSPRRDQLQNAATMALMEQHTTTPHKKWQRYEQPLQLILQTFNTMSDKSEDFWRKSTKYFIRKTYPAGTVIYSSGDSPNGFYILETGILKAKYRLPQGTFTEVIVAGATCGELPFFSDTDRTATTFAERDSVAWMLSDEMWEELQREQPDIARELLKVGLKLTSERMDAITKYMLLTGT